MPVTGKYKIGDIVLAELYNVKSAGSKQKYTVKYCSSDPYGRTPFEWRRFEIIGATGHNYTLKIDDDSIHSWRIYELHTTESYGVPSSYIGCNGWSVGEEYLRPAEPKTRCKTCRHN